MGYVGSIYIYIYIYIYMGLVFGVLGFVARQLGASGGLRPLGNESQ